MEKVFGDVSLPFNIPSSSILSTVGCTPIMEVEPGVWGKLEGYNFSGSIKDRAMMSMVLKMFEQGDLKNGSTLTLVTSGSAGVSLALIQRALAEDCGVDLKTIIMMPKAYGKRLSPRSSLATIRCQHSMMRQTPRRTVSFCS